MKNSLILIAMFSIVLAGCSSGDGGTSTVTPFIGGTEGLQIQFLPSEPPDTIQDDGKESFTIGIEAFNKGEDDIDKNEIIFKLKGIPPADLGATIDDLSVRPDEDILGREKNPDTGNTIESPPVLVNFGPFVYDRNLAGNIEKTFYVDACYTYETFAAADLCIKENLQDSTDTDICTISGTKNFVNSGAPVQVTKFEQFGAGTDAVRFSFAINKVGTGYLTRQNSECSDNRVDEGYVYVIVDTDMSNLKCSGWIDGTDTEGYVRVLEGEREINCKQVVDDNDKYDQVNIVDIHLIYDYSDTISKIVTIKSFE